jgi:hypothetical protein
LEALAAAYAAALEYGAAAYTYTAVMTGAAVTAAAQYAASVGAPIALGSYDAEAITADMSAASDGGATASDISPLVGGSTSGPAFTPAQFQIGSSITNANVGLTTSEFQSGLTMNAGYQLSSQGASLNGTYQVFSNGLSTWTTYTRSSGGPGAAFVPIIGGGENLHISLLP